jgi:ACS family hexuronate transporter-like MFS transporter
MTNARSEPAGFPRVRWWILALLFLAIAINFIDRQVLSVVEPVLREQYHFSNTAYGWILFFFLLGMTLGQIPVGLMLDRFGARRGLPLLVVGWSIVGMFHSLARNVAQLCGLRFLLGLNECGSFSAGVKVIGEWFPAGCSTAAAWWARSSPRP